MQSSSKRLILNVVGQSNANLISECSIPPHRIALDSGAGSLRKLADVDGVPADLRRPMPRLAFLAQAEPNIADKIEFEDVLPARRHQTSSR
jgi:hypothetical protein